jgi:hypothetical protein
MKFDPAIHLPLSGNFCELCGAQSYSSRDEVCKRCGGPLFRWNARGRRRLSRTTAEPTIPTLDQLVSDPISPATMPATNN